MKKFVIGILLCLSLTIVYGQNAVCKVNDSDIASSYKGGCNNGLANGFGVARGRDIYEGEFLNGNKHGQGTYSWPNQGSKYVGEWKADNRDGQGKMTYASGGFSWDGGWKNDIRDGLGKFYLDAGQVIPAHQTKFGELIGPLGRRAVIENGTIIAIVDDKCTTKEQCLNNISAAQNRNNDKSILECKAGVNRCSNDCKVKYTNTNTVFSCQNMCRSESACQ